MRILQVVAYVSEDGVYGGPSSVAQAQSAALAELGHEVILAAGAEQAATVRRNGYEERRFRARKLMPGGSFAFLFSWSMSRVAKDLVQWADIVHVHMARDLLTLPLADVVRRSGKPYFIQPHGMIDDSRNPLSLPLDRFLTVPVLRGSHIVYALTDDEEASLRSMCPDARVARIRNGIQVSRSSAATQMARPRVVFLSRLHKRKRPDAFVEMAQILRPEFPDAHFEIAGPDEGQASSLEALIDRGGAAGFIKLIGPVAHSKVSEYLGKSSVLVLPSRGEVFPMVLLEAFQVGTPVVTTESLGIADECRKFGAAAVTDGSPAELASAVAEILRNPDRGRELSAGARSYLLQDLDIVRVAQQLESAYAKARK